MFGCYESNFKQPHVGPSLHYLTSHMVHKVMMHFLPIVNTRLFVKITVSAFPDNICNFQILLQNCSAFKLGFQHSCTTLKCNESTSETIQQTGSQRVTNSQMSSKAKTPRPAKAYRFISSTAFFWSILPWPPATCHIPKTTQQDTNHESLRKKTRQFTM